MLNFSARLTEHFTTSKSARPGNRELFFSCPKLNFSRLRRLGAVRAQPCPGLVDFAIGLVNSVFNLPDGQVIFF